MGFVECDSCRNKPGTPPLCQGCLHNRRHFADLRKIRNELSYGVGLYYFGSSEDLAKEMIEKIDELIKGE